MLTIKLTGSAECRPLRKGWMKDRQSDCCSLYRKKLKETEGAAGVWEGLQAHGISEAKEEGITNRMKSSVRSSKMRDNK